MAGLVNFVVLVDFAVVNAEEVVVAVLGICAAVEAVFVVPLVDVVV